MSHSTLRCRWRGGLALALLIALCAGVLGTSALAQDEEPDKDHWVQRYERLKSEVAELQVRVDMLEEQYKRAKRRNYPRGAQLDELRADLDEARKEFAEKQEEWESFPDEARRAGALPGWFRE